ncbi:MAG TPA: cyclic pyranopterin monophosphate synthase MoaC [Spirochaetaceae bacterium]|nr:cyclic pyranopterin monophosphate synthase MoaC [Spirochaetaceae bacterium]
MGKAEQEDFSHFDESGRAVMVDVSGKAQTSREAIAKATVRVNSNTMSLIKSGGIKKGDVLAVAQVAGIMAAKRTPDIIPMAHTLLLQSVRIEYEIDDSNNLILITSCVKCEGQTGAEMEALTAASVCALTIYDMCKAVQRDIEIADVRLQRKSGGKSGVYERKSED